VATRRKEAKNRAQEHMAGGGVLTWPGGPAAAVTMRLAWRLLRRVCDTFETSGPFADAEECNERGPVVASIKTEWTGLV
jgi:hypothetical protein